MRIRSNRKTASSPVGKASHERGSLLVEMALVGVLLVTLALGIAEIGFAWRNSAVAHQATRSGARVVSAMSQDAQADRELLRSLVPALGADQVERVEYVVVFAPTAENTMAAGCDQFSGPSCNHYTPAALAGLDDDSKWGCGAGRYDNAWCPQDRMGSIEQPVDIGVAVKLRHQWVTGIFPGGGTDIVASIVMRLEAPTQ